MNCGCDIKTVAGTGIKFNLSLNLPSGLTMDDVGFSCAFFIYTNRRKEYTKSDFTRVDANNYIVVLDTSDMGEGQIMCQIEVQLSERKEILTINTGEHVSGGLQ